MNRTQEQIRKIFDDEVGTIAKKLGAEIPKKTYRYAPYQCYKCGEKMLVYTWPNKEMSSIKTPPADKPKTIQLVTTKMSEQTYWANTCPYCNAVQGDFFLESEPDSPFFCLGGGLKDTAEDFKKDIENIANYFVVQLSGGSSTS
jgi:hypothetical protein